MQGDMSSVLFALLLFIASVVPSQAQTEAAAEAGGAADEAPELVYDVGHEVVFSCDLDNPAGLPYVWKVNDTSLEAVAALKGRTRLEQGGARLVLPARTAEDDFGNYTCAVGGASRGWRLRGRPHVKLPANTNVVEGQKVKLQCRLYGKPYPPVVWLYVNGSDAAQNATDALAALGERASLQPNEQGVPGAELVLERVQRGDAGQLLCAVLGGDEAARAATTLRVKDMYAALWPFLGICAEVFVLCAIILIYEKRRTKPELDDSDTDTHDQKKS